MSIDEEEPRPPRRAKPIPETPKGRPALPPSGKTPEGTNTWKPATAPRPPDGPSTPRSTPTKRRVSSDREPKPVEGGPNLFERVVWGKVSTGHLAIFCRQYAAYLSAGVDQIKALDSLQKQFARSALGPVIGRLSQSVRQGDALGDAFGREPQAFDNLFMSMIQVAEARGGVPETLRTLSEHYESRQRLIRQARSAMIYPAAVILVATAVGGLLTIFVLPKLVGILEDMVRGKAASLPAPTRALMAFSHFIQTIGWFVLPLAFFGIIFGVVFAYRTTRGKAALDEISLYVPVLGSLLRKIDTARFSRTLSALLSAGVDFAASLDLTANVLHLVPFRKAVRGASALIVEGTELSEALKISHRFPYDVIAVVESGEETGKLPETLDKLADDYEEQVEHMVKNLGSLIQPLIVIFLGGIVLFIALAFIMAYISVIANLAGAGG
jgi:type IV pilus assembly protein PilC